MIAIIDYGAGNLRSVKKAFDCLQQESQITGDPEQVAKASKIVLPGVGHFSSTAALSGKQANLFSDLLVHHMGTGLADDIVQGAAGPDEFRTAPLWGLGKRIFFLHDGRATDLRQAISAHSSSGSEANAVISNFDALLPQQKQDILNFLRSL